MSGIKSFRSAWDTTSLKLGRQPVCGYVKQSLNSSVIKSAAIGNFRKEYGFYSQDLILALGSSISLFSVDSLGMSIASVCSAPMFVSVLEVSCLRAPPGYSRQGADIDGGQQSDLCVVLEEGGQLALLYVEQVDAEQNYRFRAMEQIDALANCKYDGGAVVLRKTVIDSLVRAIAVVAWREFIDIVLLEWSGGDSAQAQGQEHIKPSIFGCRMGVYVNGTICDAAFLSPLRSELQRILLVAAVVERPHESVYLHLYEHWLSALGNSSVALVARLPLPHSISTPMYIVPLLEHRECFLLITETEVVFISASQIQSGDVHLYSQPIPRLLDGRPDLVRSFCMAGTTAVSVAGIQQPAQKVYISTHSGAMYCICAAARPFIQLTKVSAKHATALDSGAVLAGESILYLDPHSHKRARHMDVVEPVPDYLFISGDCVDHSIYRVSTDVGSVGIADEIPMPVWHSRRVLPNHSPMTDIMLQPQAAYWTSGRTSAGFVNQAQFGHLMRTEEIIDTARDDFSLTQLWTFYISEAAKRSVVPCIVLRQAELDIPVFKDDDGEWKLLDALRLFFNDRRLLFVGNAGISDLGEHCLLCVFDDLACLVTGVTTLGGMGENIRNLTITSLRTGEVFTHGSCVTTVATTSRSDRSVSIWAILAIRTAQRGSIVRIMSISETDGTTSSQQVPAAAAVELEFQCEVSCLRAITMGLTTYILVGTYDLRLSVFRFDSETQSATLVHSEDVGAYLELVRGNVETCDTHSNEDEGDEGKIVIGTGECSTVASISGVTVNDAYVLGSLAKLFVMAGMRDGSLIKIEISQALGAVDRELVKVGEIPVRFSGVPDCADSGGEVDYGYGLTSDAHSVLVVAESLFVAQLANVGQIKITPCVFGELQPPLSVSQAISVAPTWRSDRFGCAAPGSTSRTFSCLVASNSAGIINLLDIGLDPQCHMRELNVGEEPRRMMYDNDTDKILVAGVLAPVPSVNSRITFNSYLAALDPNDGHIHSETQLLPNELVHSLEMWPIYVPKPIRYICVGTGLYPAAEDYSRLSTERLRATGGRIVMFQLKQLKSKAQSSSANASRKYKLKSVWASDRDASVLALAYLGDPYLIAAVGTSCVVLKLDLVNGKLIECCEIDLRFPACSLDVRGNYIVAGSLRETAQLLRFDEGTGDNESLEILHSARFGLHTADTRFLTDDLVVGVNADGYLYAIGIPQDSKEFALDFAMGIHLGTNCTRVKLGNLVRRLHRPKHVLPWVHQAVGVAAATGQALPPVDTVVVSTLSGALWTLLRISDAAFKALRLLERAMLAMSADHPAYPLLVSKGSISRTPHTNNSKLQSFNIVDGMLSTIFLEVLTESEQLQVVDSSPELQVHALALGLGQCSAMDAVRRLVYALNCA
ncbi:hypothetical protein LPJ66_006681, partial [Kickxella alabastrina]